jgi:hypothetical protein
MSFGGSLMGSQFNLFDASNDQATRSRYPKIPGSKAGSGPSAAAARIMAGIAPTLRDKAMAELQQPQNASGGLTADEIAAAINSTEFAVRPRISELRRAGAIVDSGKRRTNRSGVNATVWRIAPTSIAQLTEFQAAQQYEAAERARARAPQPTHKANP